MRSLLTNRFEPRRILEQTRSKIAFIGNDHVSGKSDVLIKIFRKGFFSCDRKALAGFFSWHRGIQHPLLAQVYDAGLTANQDLYYVRENFDESWAVFSGHAEWIGQLLTAVSVVHLGNQVHASIRPSNIFRSNGSLKLADPRIFQLKPGEPTQEDIRFSAPEVLAGGKPTVESDLYSVGAVLYRALGGKDPFDDLDLDNLRAKYMWATPQPLNSICHVAESISELVACLLNKDSQTRPDMASLLSAFPNVTEAIHAPLLGREEQILTVESFFEPSSSGGLRVVLLEGDPGVGKTRLTEELAARAGFYNGNCAVGYCKQIHTSSLQPISQILESILRQRGLFGTSDFRRELGDFWATLEPFVDSENARGRDFDYPLERIISDLVGLLRLLAQKKPITLAIDDVHLADESTLQVIQQLCLRSTEISANLILTRRSNPQRFELQDLMQQCLHENFRTLQLTALTPEAAQQFLCYITKSSEKRAVTLKAAAGNPLFLEEYASCGGPCDRLPPRLEGVFQSILGSLSKSSVEMAGVLSIFHKSIPSEFLQLVSKVSTATFDNSLLELSAMGLIETVGGNVAFKHESFRRRFYTRISKSRKTRLHQLAYEVFDRPATDEELLAYHAFHGRLHDAAAHHCLKAAKDMCETGDNPGAIKFYNRAKVSLQHLGRQLEASASADLAFCYARVGKTACAEKIYEGLLKTAPVLLVESRSLLSSIYVRLTVPESRKPVSERLLLCSRALETAPPDWTQLSGVYARLTHLLVQVGQLANAEKALQLAQENLMKDPSESNGVFVQGARGYFLLHSGRFREAISTFQCLRSRQSLLAQVLTNIALCWEHLGKLRRAIKVQVEARNVADAIGYALIQVVSLINIGAFETKLGNFIEASRAFTSAASLIAELRARDRSFRPVLISVLHLDLARLQIDLGQYQEAKRSLELARKSELLGLEGGNLLITECELNICLGDTAAAKLLLNRLDRSEVFQTEFFFVERSLIESHLDEIDLQKRLDNLMQTLEVSTRIGTLYQRCKILSRLSVVLRTLGRQSEAYRYAKDALRLAEKQGYKPLAAKALLAIGLASDDHDKEKNLVAAFHTACEIGLPELQAESAFQIGLLRHAAGQYITAEEYLLKSIAGTRQLSEEIPQRFRSRYLSESWRGYALKLLQDCKNRIQTIALLRKRPVEQYTEQQYIRALYRLSLSSTILSKADNVISSLLETLASSIKRPLILILQTPKDIVCHSLRIKLSDDLRDRVRTFSERSNNRIYFGNPETGQTTDTVAWIPLRAQQYTGGIYIVCREAEPPLSEREMEFLTIIRTIGNQALDRIDNPEEAGIHQLAEFHEFHGMIGASKAIREVYSHIEIAAGNAATVLIEGESGTGKELVAKAIHETGPRAKEPFVAVDCGAIPESLIEAELFGAKKGSYTGAVVDRPGLFEAAHRGTIFLDEISNTSPALQVKLLRVLQEREVRRIGETRGRPIDVRLIVASNANLDALVREGHFRKDLLYRLNVLHIQLPPLRNRRDDIPMLAHAFLERLNAANKTKKHFAPGVINHLMTQPFPGNVRELQNAIERAFFLARSTIITEAPLEPHAEEASSSDDVQSWFKELADGRKDFWSAVHNRYKRRDISREKVIALMDYGLRSTQGSYKMMAAMFRLKEKEYRRFMDFLRRNHCLLDFRPYRKAARNTP